MKKRLLLVFAMLVALSLIATAAVSAKSSNHQKQPPSDVQVNSDARPFKAFMTGEMSWEAPAEGCPAIGDPPIPVRSHMDATGRVSHLGRSTMTGTHCTPEDIYYPDPSESSVATLVAANGDKVYLDYHGECPPLHEVPIPGVLTCSFEFDVDGGTGRFDGATGEGIGTLSMIWLGKVERADAWWTWTGTIGY